MITPRVRPRSTSCATLVWCREWIEQLAGKETAKSLLRVNRQRRARFPELELKLKGLFDDRRQRSHRCAHVFTVLVCPYCDMHGTFSHRPFSRAALHFRPSGSLASGCGAGCYFSCASTHPTLSSTRAGIGFTASLDAGKLPCERAVISRALAAAESTMHADGAARASRSTPAPSGCHSYRLGIGRFDACCASPLGASRWT